MKEFLARRRRPPAEPSAVEIGAARKWLARHGAEVNLPTRLPCIRIAAHLTPSTWLRTFPVYAVLGIAGSEAYLSLQELPGVHGREMTESIARYFLFAAIQVGLWRAPRVRERNLVALVPYRLTGLARPTGLLDGWYVAAATTTFAGGALLALSMVVAVPSARTYAWSWLGLLMVGAICTGVVLRSTLREPVVAENDGSLAADELLRREAIQATMPAIYALPVVFDIAGEGRQPHAAIAQRRRKLPPGYYGAIHSGTGEIGPRPERDRGRRRVEARRPELKRAQPDQPRPESGSPAVVASS